MVKGYSRPQTEKSGSENYSGRLMFRLQVRILPGSQNIVLLNFLILKIIILYL